MNKEHLKEAIGELQCVDTVFQSDRGIGYIDTAVSVMQVYDLVDQLDELSQEWIDKHAKAVDGIPDQTRVVYVDDLQKLLVSEVEE